MERLKNIESEKLLERKLGEAVKKLGGWSIKLLSNLITGLPDRICLLPGGILFFAEIKTTGKKPTPIQLSVHRRIRELGFKVYVIESSDDIKNIKNYYEIF